MRLVYAYDAGDDVLVVRGTIDGLVDADGELRELEARGWVSALENHYDWDAYVDVIDADLADENSPWATTGTHLRADATPRPMTDDERRDYCRNLLLEQHADELRALQDFALLVEPDKAHA